MCVCVISNQSTSKNQSTCQKSSGRGDLGGGGSKLGRNLRKGVGNTGGGRVFIK